MIHYILVIGTREKIVLKLYCEPVDIILFLNTFYKV